MLSIDTIPLSLYIHIPWCVRKCPYCDFNSHPQREPIPESLYIKALINDLKGKMSQVQGRTLHSIFIGGGTPSLLSPVAYQTLLSTIQGHIPFERGIEITLEANPGTVEQARFEGYHAAGINRISLGIQSTQADKLKALGRIHNNEEALSAIQAARAAGFDNINCDLMFGLPDQTINDALYDLQTIIDQQPTHLSWYQLTLEPNTYFHRFPPTLPDDELIVDMHQQGIELLENHGYQRYEISAYAKNQRASKHNLNYWNFGDYIGIGAGAHGKITDHTRQQISRYWNYKHPNSYLDDAKSYIANTRILYDAELPLEFLMNTLRLETPVSCELFEQSCGLPWKLLAAKLQKAQQLELCTITPTQLTLTENGKHFLNELLETLLPTKP